MEYIVESTDRLERAVVDEVVGDGQHRLGVVGIDRTGANRDVKRDESYEEKRSHKPLVVYVALAPWLHVPYFSTRRVSIPGTLIAIKRAETLEDSAPCAQLSRAPARRGDVIDPPV